MDFKNEPTYVYLWTYTQFQQEQAEWDCVNKLLQKHGFRPVHCTDPVENKNISDLVLLDQRMAAGVRLTMKTLLEDSTRSQARIQELLQSNTRLKIRLLWSLSGGVQEEGEVCEGRGAGGEPAVHWPFTKEKEVTSPGTPASQGPGRLPPNPPPTPTPCWGANLPSLPCPAPGLPGSRPSESGD